MTGPMIWQITKATGLVLAGVLVTFVLYAAVTGRNR